MEQTLSQKLAGFIATMDGKSLPEPAMEATRRAVLDWFGSAIAGSTSTPARMMLAVVKKLGHDPQATLVPSGERLPATSAALYNGAASHVVELDDVHRASITHPGAAVIPAALAVGELVKADGRSFLTAVAAGYEAGIRVGEAVTPSHYRYFHTTGTAGTFGAAAAAAKLLGLDADGIASALGSAGTQAAGLWEFLADGAMSKHLHPGKAAMNGILSALLAREGFTSASRILEGERGFFIAEAAEYDPTRVTADFGRPYKIEEDSYKIHSSCRHTHPAVDVVLELARANDLRPEDVEVVSVSAYSVALDVTNDPNPRSVYSAKFSLPFCVALSLHRRSAGATDFTEATLRDPAIRATMGRVKLVADPSLDALHPAKWPARVEIRTRDGRTLTAGTDNPRGDPENPVSTAELEEKFRGLAVPVVGEKLAERLARGVRELDRLDDVGRLLAEFRV
ncbi:MAG: MmgE/PrpD family protein [Bacillota bacterium]